MSEKFKVGDTVKITSEIPSDKDSPPSWVKQMDAYVGKSGKVIAYASSKKWYTIQFEDGRDYVFEESWVKKGLLTLTEEETLWRKKRDDIFRQIFS